VLRALAPIASRLIQREIRAGFAVLWDSLRSGAYAPLLVSTALLVAGHLDAEHWTWITAATIAADGMHRSVSTVVSGASRVFGGSGDEGGDEDGDDAGQ
jgi:hypothetical protein